MLKGAGEKIKLSVSLFAGKINSLIKEWKVYANATIGSKTTIQYADREP